jgi:hypothetical protein
VSVARQLRATTPKLESFSLRICGYLQLGNKGYLDLIAKPSSGLRTGYPGRRRANCKRCLVNQRSELDQVRPSAFGSLKFFLPCELSENKGEVGLSLSEGVTKPNSTSYS